MISSFYRRHSLPILIVCTVALPFLTWYGERIPSNNGLDAWLPTNSPARKDYDEFVRTFGDDETILIAFRRPFPEPEILQSVAGRLGALPGIKSCRTREQFVRMMLANGVDEGTANTRLVHLLQTPAGDLETLMLSLTEDRTISHKVLLAQIRGQLEYCDLSHAIVAGGPVVTAQLDMLGGRESGSGRKLFQLTLVICAVLLYLNIGCWKTSALLLVMNVFSIQCTLSVMRVLGMKMNFILGSLPVLVMVFTTSASVHLIGQYIVHAHERDSLGKAMKSVLWPSLFAALTTLIGLLSLDLSDIGPITDFGNAAAVGTMVSFIVGLGITPAVLTVVRFSAPLGVPGQGVMERMAMYILNYPKRVLVPLVLASLAGAAGLYDLRTLIDPLDFLPSSDPVLRDTLHVRKHLTSTTSIEAVIDFGGTKSSFVTRLRKVHDFEQSLMKHPNVCHTLSLADFFPDEIDQQDMSVSTLLSSSGSGAAGALLADGCRLWRVSIRLLNDRPAVLRQTLDELQGIEFSNKVTFTGLGPVLEQAQGSIFQGFWRSFSSALVIMTVVMMFALKSPLAGITAMMPNIQPIALVFGILGWISYPVDIGIMMTASIALGLTVDGTFHFLCVYHSSLRDTACRYRAVRHALLHTGMPMMSSGLISGIGLLALALSPFRPAMRFGVLMFLLMTAATISGLVIFPACLALGTKRRRLRERKTAADATLQTRAA
jgi:predicted RND superfamily exporter protein